MFWWIVHSFHPLQIDCLLQKMTVTNGISSCQFVGSMFMFWSMLKNYSISIKFISLTKWFSEQNTNKKFHMKVKVVKKVILISISHNIKNNHIILCFCMFFFYTFIVILWDLLEFSFTCSRLRRSTNFKHMFSKNSHCTSQT